MVEQLLQIISEIAELQRLRGILASTVTARIPGHRAETVAKVFELTGPVGAITADAVKKHHQRTAAGDIISDGNRTFGVPCRAHTCSFMSVLPRIIGRRG